jgi:hypothetical protein
MAIRAYVGESMVYRTAGLLDAALERVNVDNPQEALKAMEEYAVECAAIKVLGSEFLDFVADEGVQIFGGYGYSREYPVEMPYRDSRINRIFEGTNEINRLLILGMLMKRAMKGELPLLAAAQKLQDELLGFPGIEEEDDRPFAREEKAVKNMKKIALMTAGLAAQKYMMALEEEQEVMGHISDIVMETWASESALLRARKIASTAGASKAEPYCLMTRCYINDSIGRVEQHAKDLLAAVSEGDMLRTNLAALRRFLKFAPLNTIDIRRKIADIMLEADRYPF